MGKISTLPILTTPDGTDYMIVLDTSTNTTKKVLISDLYSQQLTGTSGLVDEAVTAAKIANRTRTVMFDTRADGTGGAVDGQNEGSPETAFTGTPTGYMRGRLIVPNDYVSGTTAVLHVVLRATNTGTHTSIHYVGSRSSADGTAWSSWNVQSGVSTTSISFTAAQIKNQSVYTIPAANLSAGQFIAVAYRISTAITGTIYGLAMYLEYTADS